MIDRTTYNAFVDQLEKCAMTFAFFDELERLEKQANQPKPKNLQEKVLMGIDRARPYGYRAAMGAVPGVVVGNVFGGRRGAAIGGTIGAGVGFADRYLEDQADKSRKMRRLLASYKERLS